MNTLTRHIQLLYQLIYNNSKLQSLVTVETLLEFNQNQAQYKIESFTLGSTNPTSPTFFIVGGIHGLERIGAELCCSLLNSILNRVLWDKTLQHILKNIRMIFIPFANPYGFVNYSRCNKNGVDLMRNSPVDAEEKVPFLLGGQRYSSRLPWYRGQPGIIEDENMAIINKFFNSCSESKCVISLDLHSGFGFRDRLWFPYSKTKKPFEHLPEMHFFTQLFESTHPYHVYCIEPQSYGYLLNGDLWDYIYLEFLRKNKNTYLPLTLEMGSWIWVKKNPLQIISKHGMFNPIKDHRIKRTFRRHHILFDFIIKSLYSFESWSCLNEIERQNHFHHSLDTWYGKN